MTVREKILAEAEKHIGVREKGRNRGFWVEKFLGAVGLGPGYAWCAAFVSYVLKQVGHPFGPAKGKAAVWNWHKYGANIGRIVSVRDVIPGDLFFWTNEDGTGHIGFVAGIPVLGSDGMHRFPTIEGNTNSGGSREGDGVYKRIRKADRKTMFLRVA